MNTLTHRMYDPRSVESYARISMEEQLMAVAGRHDANPRQYRQRLHDLTYAELEAEFRATMEEAVI